MAMERDDNPATSANIIQFDAEKVFENKLQRYERELAMLRTGYGKLKGAPTLTELPEQPEQPEDLIAKFIYSDDEMSDLQPTQWLYYPFLVGNAISVIAGESGSLKSFAALHIGLELARRNKRVLYLAGEGADGVKKRKRAWELHYNGEFILPNNLFALAKVRFYPGDVESLGALLKLLEQFQPDLVVIDTLARSMGALDENKQSDFGRYLQAIETLQGVNGAAILLVHHYNKAGNARGSTRITCDTDIVFESKYDQEHKTVTFKCTKHKDESKDKNVIMKPLVIELPGLIDQETGNPVTSLVLEAATEEDTADGEFKGKYSETVLEYLVSQDDQKQFKNGELQKAIGLFSKGNEKKADTAKQYFYKSMTELNEKGYVKKTKIGKNVFYQLTAEGKQAADDFFGIDFEGASGSEQEEQEIE